MFCTLSYRWLNACWISLPYFLLPDSSLRRLSSQCFLVILYFVCSLVCRKISGAFAHFSRARLACQHRTNILSVFTVCRQNRWNDDERARFGRGRSLSICISVEIATRIDRATATPERPGRNDPHAGWPVWDEPDRTDVTTGDGLEPPLYACFSTVRHLVGGKYRCEYFFDGTSAHIRTFTTLQISLNRRQKRQRSKDIMKAYDVSGRTWLTIPPA